MSLKRDLPELCCLEYMYFGAKLARPQVRWKYSQTLFGSVSEEFLDVEPLPTSKLKDVPTISGPLLHACHSSDCFKKGFGGVYSMRQNLPGFKFPLWRLH